MHTTVSMVVLSPFSSGRLVETLDSGLATHPKSTAGRPGLEPGLSAARFLKKTPRKYTAKPREVACRPQAPQGVGAKLTPNDLKEIF